MKNVIVLISHGELSKGMANSAQMIVGKSDNIYYYGLMPGEHPSEIVKDIKEEILEKNIDKKVIIVSDIVGGSMCNSAMELLEFENVTLIGGMNLQLVVDLILQEELSEEDCENIVDNSKDGIQLIKKSIVNKDSDDKNDFF